MLKGMDVLLEFDGVILGGQRGVDMQFSRDVIDTTRRGATLKTSDTSCLKGVDISLDGLMVFGENNENILMDKFNSNASIGVLVVEGTLELLRGTYKISELSVNAPLDDMVTFSATLVNFGE